MEEIIILENIRYVIKYNGSDNPIVKIILKLNGSISTSKWRNKVYGPFWRDVDFSKEQIALRSNLLNSILRYLMTIQENPTGIEIFETNIRDKVTEALNAINIDTPAESGTELDTLINATREAAMPSLRTNLSNLVQNHINSGGLRNTNNNHMMATICDTLISIIENTLTDSIATHCGKFFKEGTLDTNLLNGKISCEKLYEGSDIAGFEAVLKDGTGGTTTHRMIYGLRTTLKTYKENLLKNRFPDCSQWPFEEISATEILYKEIAINPVSWGYEKLSKGYG